ncbi:MAG TPA: hypothetical protein VII87_14135 [Solirubrobacteraceae bacterium]|jgi:hypothetical protein
MDEPNSSHPQAADEQDSTEPTTKATQAPPNPETDEESVEKGKEQLGKVSGN